MHRRPKSFDLLGIPIGQMEFDEFRFGQRYFQVRRPATHDFGHVDRFDVAHFDPGQDFRIQFQDLGGTGLPRDLEDRQIVCPPRNIVVQARDQQPSVQRFVLGEQTNRALVMLNGADPIPTLLDPETFLQPGLRGRDRLFAGRYGLPPSHRRNDCARQQKTTDSGAGKPKHGHSSRELTS